MPGHRRKSFTLIELLVVVAIISILAALLLPSLGRTRETAKRVACMSNMKQVSLGLFMLADANNGWLNGINASYDSGGAAANVTNWTVAISSYLGGGVTSSGEARMVAVDGTGCPGRRKAYVDSTVGWADNYYPYGVNSLFSGKQLAPMHSLNEVVNSTRIYLISDCFSAWPYSLDPQYQGAMTIDGNWSGGIYLHAPHPAGRNSAPEVKRIGNGLNFIFVDGHGEFWKRYGAASWDQVTGFTYGKAVSWPNTGTYDMMGE